MSKLLWASGEAEADPGLGEQQLQVREAIEQPRKDQAHHRVHVIEREAEAIVQPPATEALMADLGGVGVAMQREHDTEALGFGEQIP